MSHARKLGIVSLLVAAALVAALFAPAAALAAVGGPYSESVSNPEDNGVFGPSGGSLDLHGVGRLDIPDGALAAPTPISGIVWNVSGGPKTLEGDEMRTVVEFKPDGTTFATPVTLSLTIPGGIRPETAQIYEWNPGTSTWAAKSSTRNGNRVTTDIGHFSWYAVGGQPIVVSTPASSTWSLAVFVGLALVLAPTIRRLSAARH